MCPSRLAVLVALFLCVIGTLSAAAAEWAPGVSYSVNALVTYQGPTYRCVQAHASQVGWEPPNGDSDVAPADGEAHRLAADDTAPDVHAAPHVDSSADFDGHCHRHVARRDSVLGLRGLLSGRNLRPVRRRDLSMPSVAHVRSVSHPAERTRTVDADLGVARPVSYHRPRPAVADGPRSRPGDAGASVAPASGRPITSPETPAGTRRVSRTRSR
jgi:hypothetical protein